MKPFLYILFSLQLLGNSVFAQDEQAFFIKKIYNHSLENSLCDQWLSYLSDTIGGRLTGSENAELAVDYTYDILRQLPIVDKVTKQPCQVPKWVRGDREIANIRWGDEKKGTYDAQKINVLSLGNSIATPNRGIIADIIEVHSLDTLDELGPEKLKDKVVFFNRPMDPTKIHTGHAYGEAVDQRVHGASRAAVHGAQAVLVRSVTLQQDDLPHTGVQSYAEGVRQIPSLAVSTNHANKISELLQTKKVTVYLKNNPQMLDSVMSHNVIAEIKGSEFPDEIILVGGHLDSWDVGGGALSDVSCL